MSRDAMSKVLMVGVLLVMLGGTVKLALDAQEAEERRKAETFPSESKEAIRREVRRIIREAIYAHNQLDYETAEKLLVEASERYPQIAAVWLNLGICYRSLNKLDAADRAFARVLELNEQDWDAVAERATVRLQRGQVDEAFAMLERVPAQKGQTQERLRGDPIWTEHRDHPRMGPLMVKHGLAKTSPASPPPPTQAATSSAADARP